MWKYLTSPNGTNVLRQLATCSQSFSESDSRSGSS